MSNGDVAMCIYNSALPGCIRIGVSQTKPLGAGNSVTPSALYELSVDAMEDFGAFSADIGSVNYANTDGGYLSAISQGVKERTLVFGVVQSGTLSIDEMRRAVMRVFRPGDELQCTVSRMGVTRTFTAYCRDFKASNVNVYTTPTFTVTLVSESPYLSGETVSASAALRDDKRALLTLPPSVCDARRVGFAVMFRVTGVRSISIERVSTPTSTSGTAIATSSTTYDFGGIIQLDTRTVPFSVVSIQISPSASSSYLTIEPRFTNYILVTAKDSSGAIVAPVSCQAAYTPLFLGI